MQSTTGSSGERTEKLQDSLDSLTKEINRLKQHILMRVEQINRKLQLLEFQLGLSRKKKYDKKMLDAMVSFGELDGFRLNSQIFGGQRTINQQEDMAPSPMLAQQLQELQLSQPPQQQLQQFQPQ